MTDPSPRLFSDDVAIARIGAGLLARTLPRVEWTHEAHLAATAWLIRERRDIELDTVLPVIIRGYNEAVGGVNDDTSGYHDTITQTYLASTRAFLRRRPAGETLVASVNALLGSPEGRRDWPLRFYSPELLFSVEARRGFVAPDRI